MQKEHQKRDTRIPAEVVLTELLDNRTYYGTLPNGKKIFVHESGLSAPHPRSVGEHVRVGLSLCDFSRGEILA
jgi:hypothetical protein